MWPWGVQVDGPADGGSGEVSLAGVGPAGNLDIVRAVAPRFQHPPLPPRVVVAVVQVDRAAYASREVLLAGVGSREDLDVPVPMMDEVRSDQMMMMITKSSIVHQYL